MSARSRPARTGDIARLARAMPYVTEVTGTQDRPVFQVGGRSFVFFRNPRPDAVDEHGERLADVVMFWVATDADKQALLQDEDSPFFSTPHFAGHPSVLLREADVGRLTLAEVTEIVQDAWLSRASARRGERWLAEHGLRG